MDEKVVQIAKAIKEAGGTAYLVGGCVRDEIMGKQPKDYDIEVYNLASEKLYEVISKFGKVDTVGASFQVYKVGQDIDISLPRRERKVGKGHKGFLVEGDPYMAFDEACYRRDFTICAIMKNPLTGEIIDPYNGRKDIEDKIIRMVSPSSFQEDSLRVLRLAQFASRFNFNVAPYTAVVARQTDLSDLPKERIWAEIEKLLMKSQYPSFGVEKLFELEIQTKLFPSLIWNPRQACAIDKALHFCNDLCYEEKLAVLVAILTWDSNFDIFDELGLTSVNGYPLREVVKNLYLGSYEVFYDDYSYHKLSQKLHMKLFSKILYAFNLNRADEFANTIERLKIEDKPVEAILKGRHLIELGIEPNPNFGKILAEVYENQIKGKVTNLQKAKELAFKYYNDTI